MTRLFKKQVSKCYSGEQDQF